jgi:4-amino-4-deoxy-L-arabinose transferase-like glycosyltransferase
VKNMPPNVVRACVLLAIAAFVFAVSGRIGFDFELEWQEGGMLQHAQRFTEGKPIYGEPSLDFAAFPYPPLFHWVSAALLAVGLDGLMAARLVSVLATVGICVLLYRMSAQAAGALAGLASIGLYLASYRFAGAWMDLGRVDSLCLFLMLAGTQVSRRQSIQAACVAGCLFALAVLTKQIAVPVALALGLVHVATHRKRGAAFLITWLVSLALVSLVLELNSGGWFRWYVIDMMAGHARHAPAITGFWREIGITYSPLLTLSLIWFMLAGRSGLALSRETLAVCLALVLVAFLSRIHVGGYDNTLLPACLALAWIGGPVLARAIEAGNWRSSMAAALCVAQFGLLAYDPRAQWPSEEDAQYAQSWVETLEAVDGPVLAPYSVELARQAGKGSSVHAMSMIDILQSSDTERARALVVALEQALLSKRYHAIVLADTSWEIDLPALRTHYRRATTPLDEAPPDAMRCATGAEHRPAVLYLRR